MLQLTRELGPSSTLVLARLLHHYNYISLFTANLGTISLAFTALAVAGADGLTEGSSAVVAILMSATMSAIVAIMIAIMHRSKPCFQRLDLIAASTPLVLVDLVVLEILVGLLVWYTSSFTARFATYLAIELLVLMTMMVLVAIWVWRKIRILIRLGHFNSVESYNAIDGQQVQK